MCKTFDDLFTAYLAGVQAGEAAFKMREALYCDRLQPAYREACAAEHAAHVRVQQARAGIEAHKRECLPCREMTRQRTTSRARVDDVDPREFEQPPMIEMWEAMR